MDTNRKPTRASTSCRLVTRIRISRVRFALCHIAQDFANLTMLLHAKQWLSVCACAFDASSLVIELRTVHLSTSVLVAVTIPWQYVNIARTKLELQLLASDCSNFRHNNQPPVAKCQHLRLHRQIDRLTHLHHKHQTMSRLSHLKEEPLNSRSTLCPSKLTQMCHITLMSQ